MGLLFKAGLLYVGGELRYTGLVKKAGADNVSMLAIVGITL